MLLCYAPSTWALRSLRPLPFLPISTLLTSIILFTDKSMNTTFKQNVDVADLHDAQQWNAAEEKVYKLTVESKDGQPLLTLTAPTEEMLLEKLGSHERFLKRVSANFF